ncbi:MAG: right-handed parallel beta-helix repeat-containing protein [Verrucomicrobiota bacterium]
MATIKRVLGNDCVMKPWIGRVGFVVVFGLMVLLCGCSRAGESDGPAEEAAFDIASVALGGRVVIPAGRYRIEETLEIRLAETGATSISAEGPVTIEMAGPGPAIRIVGSHEGRAGPDTFEEETWLERMPLVDGIEILGMHPEADGIELEKTMQATISRVVVRKARHGIRLVNRNRNVIIAACHLYENSGGGVFLDDVDLHQINIGDCHISYNPGGGVVVENGNVRNLHIGNCDLESNMPDDPKAAETRAANVLIDVSDGSEKQSVAEVAITGCTLQHNSVAAAGANIRLLGREDYPINVVTIGNNVMSDSKLGLYFDQVRELAVTGNVFFTSQPADIFMVRCERAVFTGNQFDPRNMEWKSDSIGGAAFVFCRDLVFNGMQFGGIRNPNGALIFDQCERVIVNACSFRDCSNGMVFVECEDSVVSNCLVSGTGDGGLDLDVYEGRNMRVLGNLFEGGTRLKGVNIRQ